MFIYSLFSTYKIVEMNTISEDIEIVHYDEKFGLITKNQIILFNKNVQDKIDFRSIKKVNLIKKRVFYLNIFFVSISVLLFTLSYVFSLKQSTIFYYFLLLGIIGMLLSITHKFYHYKMIIEENNQSIHELNTNQLNRESIKEFYFNIAVKFNKNKINLQKEIELFQPNS
jgi:hypothetical protein